MNNILRTFILIGIALLIACKQTNDDAKLYVQQIKELYQNNQYDEAQRKVDSIKILFPKSFDEIKESLSLLQDIRRAKNQRIILKCDSLIADYEYRFNSLKPLFVYDKNSEYEEKGVFLPKSYSQNYNVSNNTLRPGVSEDGVLFIESIYIGSQQHSFIEVYTTDGLSAKTLPLTDDGLNFRFSDLGKQYEIIKFAGTNENGISRFIVTNEEKPMTIAIKGKGQARYLLSKQTKQEIKDAYALSSVILTLNSVKKEKEKAEILLKYLNSKTEENNSNESN